MKQYKQQGVTLVELAIVVAIMGLLIAGTIGGFQLVKAATLRKIAVEFERINTVIKEFEDEYEYLPGDAANATSLLGSASDGDGDGFVEFSESTNGAPYEDTLVWEHLYRAELIPGGEGGLYTGAPVSATVRYELLTNVPESVAYKGGGWMFRTESNSAGDTIYNTRGITIRLGSLVDISGTAQQYPTGGIMTARDAYSLDVKLDDGLAASGIVYGIREINSAGSGSGCVNNLWSDSTAVYLLDDSSITCSIVYWYKKL